VGWEPGERARYLVRICGNAGAVGCGFLVDPQHVMTCAHVVAQAVGDLQGRYSSSVVPPPGPVRVEFQWPPEKGKPASFLAEPVESAWHPEKAPQAPKDIAVLRLLEPPPTGTRTIWVAPFIHADDSFTAYGIKQYFAEGTWVHGQITDAVEDGILEVFCEHKELAIRKGCSGGAAWSKQHNGILGMVAALTSEHKGHLIPIDHLKRVWPLDQSPSHSDATGGRPAAGYALPAHVGGLLHRCDRELQESQFDQGMEDNWLELRGVVVCAIAGVPADLPHLCRERCISTQLRKHLADLRIRKLPTVNKIQWPSDPYQKPSATLLLLQKQVRTVVSAESPLPADIRAAINGGVAPWVFSLTLEKRSFGSGHLGVLLDFVQFWRDVGAAGLNTPVVVFLLLDMAGDPPADFCLREFYDHRLPQLLSPPLVRLAVLNDFPPEDVQTWLQRIADEARVAEDVLDNMILDLWKQFPSQSRLRLADVEKWLRTRVI
jgi:hypothetical protein